MTAEEIVKRVRLALDEQSQAGTDLTDITEDEASLTRIILDKISYALTFILENAPVDKLDNDSLTVLTATQIQNLFAITTDMVGILKLPENLLRIVEARLSSWSYFPVPEHDATPTALMQQDEYARGSWDRPVNIFTHIGTDRVLEMYSAKTNSDTLNFSYIEKPDVSYVTEDNMNVTNVSVPVKLEAALVYQVAALTMVAFREEVAQTLFSIARSYMGIEQTEE